jgi:hypothetical protein
LTWSVTRGLLMRGELITTLLDDEVAIWYCTLPGSALSTFL